jgi:hypothetical protein
MADICFHTWLSRDKTLTFDTQVTDKSDMYTDIVTNVDMYLYSIRG